MVTVIDVIVLAVRWEDEGDVDNEEADEIEDTGVTAAVLPEPVLARRFGLLPLFVGVFALPLRLPEGTDDDTNDGCILFSRTLFRNVFTSFVYTSSYSLLGTNER